jgi:hypothetical protein
MDSNFAGSIGYFLERLLMKGFKTCAPRKRLSGRKHGSVECKVLRRDGCWSLIHCLYVREIFG